MLFLILYVAALLFAAVHTVVRRSRLSRQAAIEIFLLYLFAFSYGLTGLIGFVGHGLMPEVTAPRIGWPAHPQFQFELGSFELGVAIAAFLCLFIRNKYYWLGVAIIPVFPLLMAGGLHIYEVLEKGNFAPDNVSIITPDLLIPLTILGLIWYYFRLSNESSEAFQGEEVDMSSRSVGRLLLTLAIIIYLVLTLAIDWTEGHLADPSWPPHAHFHILTDNGTLVIFSLASLWWLWGPSREDAFSAKFALLVSVAFGLPFYPAALFPGVSVYATKELAEHSVPYNPLLFVAVIMAISMAGYWLARRKEG